MNRTSVGATQKRALRWLHVSTYHAIAFVVATLLGSTIASAQSTPAIDVDGDGYCDAITDATMILRHLLGVKGDALTNNAMSVAATASAAQIPTNIAALLATPSPQLDIDGNGQVNALTDGLILLRYALGISNTSLLAGTNAPASNFAQIVGYLQSKCGTPSPNSCGVYVEKTGVFGIPKVNQSFTLPKPSNCPVSGCEMYFPDVQATIRAGGKDPDTIDRLYIPAGDYQLLNIGNLPRRSADNPLVITNIGGQVRVRSDYGNGYNTIMSGGTHWTLTGRYDPVSKTGDANFRGHARGDHANSRGKYGIEIDGQYQLPITNASGVRHYEGTLFAVGSVKVPDGTIPNRPNQTLQRITNAPSNFEIEFIELHSGRFSGLTVKTSNRFLCEKVNSSVCNEYWHEITNIDVADVDNLKIHDVYVHDMNAEGFYIGAVDRMVGRDNATGADLTKPEQHRFTNARIYNNRIVRVGAEGMQMNNQGGGNEIFNNVFFLTALDWRSPFQGDGQDGGIQLGQRRGVNTFRNNIVVGGASNNLILFGFGDVVNEPGRSASDTLVIKDNYVSTSKWMGIYLTSRNDTKTTFRIANNWIRDQPAIAPYTVFPDNQYYYSNIDSRPPRKYVTLQDDFNTVKFEIVDTKYDGEANSLVARMNGAPADGINCPVLGTGYCAKSTGSTIYGHQDYPFFAAQNNVRQVVAPVTFANAMDASIAASDWRKISRWWLKYGPVQDTVKFNGGVDIPYKTGEIVLEDKTLYRALSDNTAKQPSLNPNVWQALPAPKDDLRLSCSSPFASAGLIDRVR